MNIPSEGFVPNSTTTVPEEKQKIATHLVRESQTKIILYRHLNHESRQLNQATYMSYSKHKQQTDVPKNIEVSSIQSSDNDSSQVSSNWNIPQKINLIWSDPFLVQQFYLSLQGSYQLVSMEMTILRRKDIRNGKRDQAFSSASFEDKAFWKGRQCYEYNLCKSNKYR